jgi:hypothetical protein
MCTLDTAQSTPTLRSICNDPIYARFESIAGEAKGAYLQTTAEGSPMVTTDLSKVSRRSDCFPRLFLGDDQVKSEGDSALVLVKALTTEKLSS